MRGLKKILLSVLIGQFLVLHAKEDIVNDRPVIVELTRKKVEIIMSQFCFEQKSRNYGGFVSGEIKPYADTRNSVYKGVYLMAAYIYPDFPEYYNNPEVLDKILIHIDFMLRRQRPNGSINFNVKSVGGANEVGFTLPGLVEVYKKIKKAEVKGKDEILKGLETYIKKGAARIRNGFPYSSNHRWAAICGPLAMTHSIFPHPENKKYIDDYLSDGIDMDNHGMYYEERSPNYNNVANWGLLELADYWGREDYIDMVALNLSYNLAMRQPSGEAETLFSHRQDRGVAHQDWGEYYHYKRLAIERNNGVFATLADLLLRKMKKKEQLPDGNIPLIFLFDDETIVNDTVLRKPVPENYNIRFEESPVWRFRTKDVAVTIAADKGDHWWDITQGTWKGYQRSDVFMSYHFQDVIIDAIRIRWTGGNDSFHPEAIEYLENGSMRLVYKDPGWDHVAHFRPEEKWGPRKVEGHSKGEVTVTPLDSGKFKMHIKISGWDEVHTNIQFLLRQDNQLITPGKKIVKTVKKGKTFSMSSGNYYIVSPSGNKLKISGIRESEHIIGLNDSQYIETNADGRCHKLILGYYTPVDLEILFEPIFNNSSFTNN